jgi:RimJ/RimL family protein N-acetyltransferase
VTKIRPATARDAADIGESHAEAWKVAYRDLFPDGFLFDAVEARRRRWRDKWPDMEDDSFILVAEGDGRVVGFVHCGWCADDPTMQEVFGFYVHPDHWGRGVAAPLISEALNRLARRSAGRVVLWTHPGAARAQRFYTRTGWVPSGLTRQHDFGDGNPSSLVQYTISIDRPRAPSDP